MANRHCSSADERSGSGQWQYLPLAITAGPAELRLIDSSKMPADLRVLTSAPEHGRLHR